MSQIAVIRIKGRVGLNKDINETLNRLRIRRKYTCVVLKGTKEELGMINKLRDFVAYGEMKDDVYKELVNKRGKKDHLHARTRMPWMNPKNILV